MIVEVEVPAQGLTITEATLLRVFKNVGDIVQSGEPLFEIETDAHIMIAWADDQPGIRFGQRVPDEVCADESGSAGHDDSLHSVKISLQIVEQTSAQIHG